MRKRKQISIGDTLAKRGMWTMCRGQNQTLGATLMLYHQDVEKALLAEVAVEGVVEDQYRRLGKDITI
jgi:hypothetical protein